ncbi:MAG: metallophosphoesterase [Bacteroidales bacterium]|nr:metallophosphoesterase [Bacteroidales bacterium]
MRKLCMIVVICMISTVAVVGQVGINTDGSLPDSSAGLDVKFSNKGFLPPRIALSSVNEAAPIVNPATGLLVFNTSNTGHTVNDVQMGYYYWNGAKWIPLVRNSETVTGTEVSDSGIWIKSVSNVELRVRTDTLRMPKVTAGPRSLNNDPDFTMVLIPDGHMWINTDKWCVASNSITRWIKAHKSEQNIVAVMQVGDISEDNLYWPSVVRGLDTLKASGIPYVVTIGNHDYTNMGTRNAADWNANLPVSRFYGETWYGGAYGASTTNMYIKFSVGERKYLIFGIEIFPRDHIIAWMNSIIAANADREVIVATHDHLRPNAQRSTRFDIYNIGYYGGMAGNDAQQLWDKCLKKHANVIMVVNGHQIDGDRTAVLTSIGEKGNIVNQIFNNYQQVYSGNMVTEVMLLKFSPSTGKIFTKTYAPFTNTYDSVGNYSLPYTAPLFDMDLKTSGNLMVTGAITSSGEISTNGSIIASKDIISAGNIRAGQNVTIDNSLSVKDNLSINKNLTVNDTVKARIYRGLGSTPALFVNNPTISDTLVVNRIKTSGTSPVMMMNDKNTASLHLNHYGFNPTIAGTRYNGSFKYPSKVLAGNVILDITGNGYVETQPAGLVYNKAGISFKAAEDFTRTASGTYMSFSTTALGTSNAVERMRIKDNGNIGVGTSNPLSALDVNGMITATGGNSSDWNIAYNWGSHALAGYAQTASPTFTGTVTLANYTLDNSPPDITSSGELLRINAGEAVNIGDVIYIGSTGSAMLCKADTIINCPYAFAIATGPTPQNSTGIFMTRGVLRSDKWPDWTVGGLLYVSTTGTTTNTLTQTPPGALNNIIIPVGVALAPKIIYFFGNFNGVVNKNPTGTYMISQITN